MISVPPRLITCGDAAFGVEFGDGVDPDINSCVLALDTAIAEQSIDGIVETVPTYRSLLIHVDTLGADIEAIARTVLALAHQIVPQQRASRR